MPPRRWPPACRRRASRPWPRRRGRYRPVGPLLAARAAAGPGPPLPWRPAPGQSLPLDGRVTPFDALEFDEALATIDTGYDLAFLLMDLDHRVGRAAANRVLNRYVARSGDAGLVAALPFWLSLRAIIRAHATAKPWRRSRPALSRPGGGDAGPPPPRLVAVGGLQGTGKAGWRVPWPRRSAPAPGALVLRSDEIRKRRAGLPPEQRLPPAAYTPEASAAVFAELTETAAAALRAGHAVVADAAFLAPGGARGDRGRGAATALYGLWLEAPCLQAPSPRGTRQGVTRRAARCLRCRCRGAGRGGGAGSRTDRLAGAGCGRRPHPGGAGAAGLGRAIIDRLLVSRESVLAFRHPRRLGDAPWPTDVCCCP